MLVTRPSNVCQSSSLVLPTGNGETDGLLAMIVELLVPIWGILVTFTMTFKSKEMTVDLVT